MPHAAPDGLHRLRALAAAMPSAFLEGFRLGRELSIPSESTPAPLYVVGMGGSGIAGELVRGLVDAEASGPLIVVRSPGLPAPVNARARVVVVSYSGNTTEALQAYDAAARGGAPRVVVTSGGALAERAARDGVPMLPLPPGRPPRAAVGSILGGLLGLLDPWFPESNDERVRRVAEGLRSYVAACARPRGPAARIAEAIGPRLPFLYADSDFAGVARRWATQFEENAKRLAVFDESPEILHNAVVAWAALSRREAGRLAVVQLLWDGARPPAPRLADAVRSLLAERGVRVVRASLTGSDRLEAIVGGIALGDHVSLFLAERGGVDPEPVETIARFKAIAPPPTPPPPARTGPPTRRAPGARRRTGSRGAARQ